jgi:hypothetical protein
MFVRQFVYSEAAQIEIDTARRKLANVDDLLMAVEWVIGRNPHRGHDLGDGKRFVYRTRKVSSLYPIATILYSFDENEVSVEHIWIRPE